MTPKRQYRNNAIIIGFDGYQSLAAAVISQAVRDSKYQNNKKVTAWLHTTSRDWAETLGQDSAVYIDKLRCYD